MIKLLIILAAVSLVGCASKPQQQYQPADMTNFVANCRVAKSQIDFLQREIDAYLAYHRDVPVTLADQRYYGKLKNNIWALRSTCPAKYL